MAVSVVPITDRIIGKDTTSSHCEPIDLFGLSVINEATYLPFVPANKPSFFYQPSLDGRMGVFAVTAGSVTRAWVLLLPDSGTPNRLMIGILPSIGQAAAYYSALGAGDPLSPPLIRDYAALVAGVDPFSGKKRGGKVQAHYGTQVLSSDRPMALLIPVRALRNAGGSDPELGPFAEDAQVIADTINAIADATGNAFSADVVEAFTHSNGISTFNTFLDALSNNFTVRVAIGIDPARAQAITSGLAATVVQHLSGQTGGIFNGRPMGGFDYWPLDRWQNEPERDHQMRMFHNNQFVYLHNWALPRYLLRFSIQMTMG
jgi:hypothetical protein